MARAKPFLFGSLLGAITMFVALQYHIVRSHDGFQFVPRTPQHSLGLAYADIRQWSATQWTDRTELARALMAHGSGDLIAQSVAENLVDSVSSERATLDQLKTFMNKPVTDGEADGDGLFRLPDLQPLKSSGGEAGSDVFAIPFPPEASKKPDTADPFRLAQTPAAAPATADNSAASSSAPRSRFSASDFLNSTENPSIGGEFREVPVPAVGTKAPAGSASAGSTPSPKSDTRKYADSVENAIFGPSASATATGGTNAASTPSAPAKVAAVGTPAATSAPASGAAPFGDISADLESRARSALSRAQASLSSQASQTLNQGTTAAGEYVRDRVSESASAGLSAVLPSSVAPAGSAPATSTQGTDLSRQTLESLRDKFDPFLE